MNACFSINRKKGHVTIYNLNQSFPLMEWNELRTAHDQTHQELANAMVNMSKKEIDS